SSTPFDDSGGSARGVVQRHRSAAGERRVLTSRNTDPGVPAGVVHQNLARVGDAITINVQEAKTWFAGDAQTDVGVEGEIVAGKAAFHRDRCRAVPVVNEDIAA